MKVNIEDGKENIISDQKPYEDGLEGTTNIINIYSPTLSLDGKSVLFITEKWATANELVKVDLESGKWTELFTAESFEQINKEPYKGFFLVSQSDIGEEGRDIFFRLVDDKGKIVKKFKDEQEMKEFRAGLK